MEGSLGAVVAGDEGVDFCIRKNEAILGRIAGLLVLSMPFDEIGGLVELAGFLGETFGLKLARGAGREC
jgi:hypothetical protein